VQIHRNAILQPISKQGGPAIKNATFISVAAIFLLYTAAIILGLHAKGIANSLPTFLDTPHPHATWHPPSYIPDTPTGDSIRLGQRIFNETSLYAASHTGATISCASCHAEGGIQPYASPMVGLPPTFPQFNARAGHIISLEDRIQECFVRSENGTPLDYKGPEMRAVVAYINWLSQPTPGNAGAKFTGRGLVTLADLTPDPVNGAAIYAAQCAGCHGANGEGRRPVFPALWGPHSFNDGAGMHGIKKMAAFVQHNMPQNRMGILTPQQAYDVAAYIHAQPRPAFNKQYAHY
jgi:thiosulfate dehydrogenase